MSSSRLLTDKEIENILDFIKPNIHIPPDSAKSIVKLMKNRFRKQLMNQKVYPEVIPELKKLLEKNYRESQIHSGESVGIIAAQSIGERQTQNSIAYDEEITVKENGNITKIKIGEFIDKYMESFGFLSIDERSHIKEIEVSEGIEIMTISQDEKIQWQPISEVSRHAPKGNLVKVTTESGRTVISTMSHSHLKKDKRKIVPVLGSDLKLGDRIPVIKSTPTANCNVLAKLDLAEYDNFIVGPREYDSDGEIPEDSPNTDNYVYYKGNSFQRYIEVDDLFIWFLGVILGENVNISHSINIKQKNYDEVFFQKIEKICTKYSLIHTVIQTDKYFFQSFKNDLPTTYELESEVFVNFIKSLTNDANNIPEFIFGLEKDKLWLFMNTYFQYGGFTKVGAINQDITFLLTYFGIYIRTHLDKILIQRDYVSIFEDEFILEVPKNNLEDNFHTLDDQELNEETTLLIHNLKTKNIDLESAKIVNSRLLSSFIADYTVESHNYNNSRNNDYIDINENLKYHCQVLLSDVVWEKIVKLELIEEKEYKFPYVYDFSVNGNETFALFSGIVVHNTLNTLN